MVLVYDIDFCRKQMMYMIISGLNLMVANYILLFILYIFFLYIYYFFIYLFYHINCGGCKVMWMFSQYTSFELISDYTII